MSNELPKAYEPQNIQDRLYSTWLSRGYFQANPQSSKKPFSIVIPPPNITGILHLGHVLNNTIQDILCRRARMEGKEVLWVPGTDHAGLATQTVVEKMLRKEEKITRFDLGREAFLQRVWTWKEKSGGTIIEQLKKLGCSLDWDRTRFTLDEDYSKAVQQVFVSLYHRGCIYRDKRMVNWCPGSLTAISDEEVMTKPQKGSLYYVKYEITDQPGVFIEVATTRPETIMGDVALVVHPQDERYAALIGKQAWRPFPRQAIPILADEAVDPKFGTGALKVTPAHDKVDFEIGQRHHLPAVDILHPNGKINCPAFPALHGLDRFEARKRAAELLQESGLLSKEEPYENNVGFSERADVPIEPRLSDQWFLDYRKMLDGKMIPEALRVVNEQLIKFFPEHWVKTYNHWLENIQPWCISRQVWWGHRIPVWYRGLKTDEGGSKTAGEVKCQIEAPGADWLQDEDSLDTWFSSWLWAYETMDLETRKKFYPTSVLVTGPDIIFLWVARMIIAGLEFRPGVDDTVKNNLPFQDVYYTGLIRDKQGRKMSKTLGNSPDPLDLIAKYGADGVRFGLMRMAPQGQDIRFDEKQIEEGRNFCNKVWNACRFRAMQGPIDPEASTSDKHLSVFCQHILARLDTFKQAYHQHLNDYEFSLAANLLYDYVWNDFCSRFIEAAKTDFGQADSPTRVGTLATFDFVISRVLRLLHPFTPFLTEELWLSLGFGTETIQFSPWPVEIESMTKPEASALEHADRAEKIYGLVDAGRNLRGEFNLPSSQKLAYLIKPTVSLTPEEVQATRSLLGASELTIVETTPAKCPMAITPLGELFLSLEGVLDPSAELARLTKEIEKAEKDLSLHEAKLNNPDMLAKAPAEKVQLWRQQAEETRAKIIKFKNQRQALE